MLLLRKYGVWGAVLAAVVFCLQTVAWPLADVETAVVIPAPIKNEAPTASRTETAIFAGGCFWGVQGVFQHVKGVTNAVSGYTGGAARTANYDNVSEGNTGHAESVQITFDPQQITYGQLLQIYFSVAHNPTELDRQGPDSGTQYRSAVFPLSASQQQVAEAYIAQLNASKRFAKPLATRIEDNGHFYPAEAYHQNYLTLNPDSPYIVVNDLPKVKQLQQLFPTQYRAEPVLVN
jgi:peptide-methionine (S)-S-oxide reductase